MNGAKITPKGMRVSAGISQKDIADYLELSLTQYQRKENGKVRFYADEIYKLSLFYNVSVSVFFIEKVSQKDT